VKIALIHRPDGLFNLKDSRGTQVVMRNECHSLLRRGFDADLVATELIYDDDLLLRERSVTIPTVRWVTKGFGRYLSELTAGWLTRDYDMLHLEGTRSIRPFDPRRSLVHLHSRIWPDKIKPSDQRRASKYHCCFVSKFVMDHYLRKYSFLREDRCHLLYNGADVDLFKPQEEKKEDIFTFGYASRLHKVKGFWVLMEAVKILESKRKDFKVLLAGGASSGAEELNMERESKFLGKMKPYLESLKTLELVGPVPHMKLPHFYNRLDAMLVPSIWEEPCPLVVLEALACGRPVIASRVGGIPEILSESAGELVASDNAEALAGAMEYWLDHPGLVREKAVEARESVLSKFTWEHHTDRLIEIYGKVQG
jgi:glycosyltransferase involved in cell wall biosynthesis